MVLKVHTSVHENYFVVHETKFETLFRYSGVADEKQNKILRCLFFLENFAVDITRKLCIGVH